MRRYLFAISISMSLFSASMVLAHNKVVVLDLSGDDSASEPTEELPFYPSLANVVFVANEGTGSFYTSIDSAMASIVGSGFTNPFIVMVGEGVFPIDGQLIVKDHVSIRGAGKNKTTLLGAISSGTVSNSALIKGADGSTIGGLRVENKPMGGTNATGIYNAGVSSQLLDVDVIVRGANTNYGIYNTGSEIEMSGVSVEVFDILHRNYGIFDSGTTSNYRSLMVDVRGNVGSHGLHAQSGSNIDVGNAVLLSNDSNEALFTSGVGFSQVVNTQIPSAAKIQVDTNTHCFHVFEPSGAPLNC